MAGVVVARAKTAKAEARIRHGARRTKLYALFALGVLCVGGGVGAALALTGESSAREQSKTEVVFSVKAAGDVSDYTTQVKDGIATAVAQRVAMERSAVTVAVQAASVIIAVTISASDSQAATSISSALGSAFSNATAATAFFASIDLGGYAIVVSEIILRPTVHSGSSSYNFTSGAGVCGLACACRADSSCIGVMAMALTTGDRSSVLRAADEAPEEGLDVDFAIERRLLHRLGDLRSKGAAGGLAAGEPLSSDLERWIEAVDGAPPQPIMSEGRRLADDVAAVDCSMPTLQALSLAWRANISSFMAELYAKKTELSAASLTLLDAYRARYSSSTPAVTDTSPAWEVAVSNETRDALQTAEAETQSLRETVQALRGELGELAQRHMSSIRGYSAIARSLQLCRRAALGLPEPTNVCNAARLAEYDALAGEADATGDEGARDEEVASAEESLAEGLLELHDTGATDAVNEAACDEHESLISSVDRVRGELSCQRKWVLKKVSEMVREAKKVLTHYNSWMRKCGGRNRRNRTPAREAYCACSCRQRSEHGARDGFISDGPCERRGSKADEAAPHIVQVAAGEAAVRAVTHRA